MIVKTVTTFAFRKETPFMTVFTHFYKTYNFAQGDCLTNGFLSVKSQLSVETLVSTN